jgi:glycosyltransferase involved in cell wall biosynthesis
LTSYYPHKNLDLIPQVIKALPSKIRGEVEFVLTLTEDQYRKHIAADIPKQIRLIGPVPPPQCPSLYRECDAMFLPTLAECFSASYPEAMKMEKPIITTDLGFARSICGDAALYFTPSDARSAAKSVVTLVQDERLRKQLLTHGESQLSQFDTASRRAEKILAICEMLAFLRKRQKR